MRVQFHPREEREILVSPMRHAAVVVYLPENPSTTTTTTTTTLNTQGAVHKLVPLDDEVVSHHYVCVSSSDGCSKGCFQPDVVMFFFKSFHFFDNYNRVTIFLRSTE